MSVRSYGESAGVEGGGGAGELSVKSCGESSGMKGGYVSKELRRVSRDKGCVCQ